MVGTGPSVGTGLMQTFVREVAMSTMPSPPRPGSQEHPRQDPGPANVSDPSDPRIGPQPPMPDFEPDAGLPGDPALEPDTWPRRRPTDPA
jgi:hypothetical protein